MDLNLNNSQKSEREFYLEDDFDFEDVESFNLRAKYNRPQENKENCHIRNIFCENNINREKELVKVRSFKLDCINSGLNTLANCGTQTEKEEVKKENKSKFSLKAYLTRTVNSMLTKEEIKKFILSLLDKEKIDIENMIYFRKLKSNSKKENYVSCLVEVICNIIKKDN